MERVTSYLDLHRCTSALLQYSKVQTLTNWIFCAKEGDITFASPLRHWMQAAAAYNVKAYGYLFSHHNPLEESALGVPHGAVLPYTFGNSLDPLPSGQELKMIIDGLLDLIYRCETTRRELTLTNLDTVLQVLDGPSTPKTNPILIQLEGGNTTTIKDDFKSQPDCVSNRQRCCA
ncbi:hypothetical protein BKA70DRAFT_1401415 [Coprinopsis sp. MPI-PUGE-AT-0042]|nr:hypothetical protein BKA70DRAFT_1401415 [Coprinopsis sp. MPI-PUGE-AT-0042]